MFSSLFCCWCCDGIQSKSIDDTPKCDYFSPDHHPRDTNVLWSGEVRGEAAERMENMKFPPFELWAFDWHLELFSKITSSSSWTQWQPNTLQSERWSICSPGMWGFLMMLLPKSMISVVAMFVCWELNNRPHHHCWARLNRHCRCCPSSSTFRWFQLDCVIPLPATQHSSLIHPFVQRALVEMRRNVDFHGQREQSEGKSSWTATAGGMENRKQSLFVVCLSTASVRNSHLRERREKQRTAEERTRPIQFSQRNFHSFL